MSGTPESETTESPSLICPICDGYKDAKRRLCFECEEYEREAAWLDAAAERDRKIEKRRQKWGNL